MNLVHKHWDEIIQKIKVEYAHSDISFRTWIAPLKLYDVTDHVVYILSDKEFSIEHLEKKFSDPFRVCIAEVTGIEYEVAFVNNNEVLTQSIIEKNDKKIAKAVDMKALRDKANLRPKYTFENFVVGNNNALAHAAAVSVAQNETIYNPLYFYGDIGLGKTHLMQCIANYMLEKDPTKKILYATSENFTNDMIDAIRVGGEQHAKFRDKYRSNDVLLIDDIQFISDKEGIQESFFNTFNDLQAAGKQIILSSDKPPKELTTLEDRLRTRFTQGMIIDIKQPNYETRMAILLKKIELESWDRFHISNEVLSYIATNVKSNIRDLEGSLQRLTLLARMEDKPIDIPMASEAIKEFITASDNREVTIDIILDAIAEHFDVPLEELKGSNRSKDIAMPRQIVMYLARKLTNQPLKTIGIYLGGKDHSTIKHGIDKVEKLMETDESFAHTISVLKKKINPL